MLAFLNCLSRLRAAALIGLPLLFAVSSTTVSAAVIASSARVASTGDVTNVVSSYTADDGLPQNSVKDVAQTPDGYVWVGTQEGLARFDGVRFTVFNTRTSPGLVSNNIHQLVVDGHGSLWVLANSGVSRYRDGVFKNVTPVSRHGVDRMLYLWHGDDGRIYASSDTSLWRSNDNGFEPMAGLKEMAVNEQFWFCCSRSGTVWMLTQQTHHLISVDNGVIRKFDESAKAPFSGISLDRSGRPWIAGARLYSVDPRTGALTDTGLVKTSIANPMAWFVADPQGAMWFWLDRKLYVFHPEERKLQVVATAPSDTAWTRIDPNGNFWALFRGGEHDKLLVITPNGQDWFETSAPVAAEWVLPVLRTADGVAFVGTYGGMTFMHPGRAQTFGQAQGVPDGEIQSVFQTREGVVYVAGIRKSVIAVPGGVGRVRVGADADKVFGTIVDGKFVPSNDPNLATADANSITQDSTGDLWISTFSNHLWRVHNGVSVDLRSKISGVDPKATINTIAACRDGGIWCAIGTNLVRFDGVRTTVYPIAKNSPIMDLIYSITAASDGRVIVGGQQGFACFDHGSFEYYGPEQGLPSVPVICIAQDRAGDIWLGLWGGGLARFKAGKIVCLSTRDGLYADSIHSIVEDNHGQMWLGSSKGVFSVDRNQISAYADAVERGDTAQNSPIVSVPLTAVDGMSAGQCAAARQPLAFVGVDGSVWFACVRGVVRVSADAPTPLRQTQFPITVEQATLDTRDIRLMGSPKMPPGPGTLQVEYTALTYVSPQKTRFMYRLFGLDTTWTDAGTRRVAYYTNLPPGHYRFKVIACDAFGNWNRAGASVEFTILPHYYQTLWFRLLMILGCLTLVAGVVLARMRQLQTLNRVLEAKVDERTKELENANQLLWDSREEVLAQNEELQAIQSELEVRNEELAEANARLNDLATVDALTAIKNRRVLEERLDYSFRVAARYGSDLCVAMIDVDSFKTYNDTHGHPAGDVVLRKVAALLSSVARDTDLVARYGGEEFIVVMPLTGIDGAVLLAERMRAAIEQENWPLRPVTASFGIASVSSQMTAPDDLTRAADAALYRAKTTGKNRVCIYVPNAKSQAA